VQQSSKCERAYLANDFSTVRSFLLIFSSSASAASSDGGGSGAAAGFVVVGEAAHAAASRAAVLDLDSAGFLTAADAPLLPGGPCSARMYSNTVVARGELARSAPAEAGRAAAGLAASAAKRAASSASGSAAAAPVASAAPACAGQAITARPLVNEGATGCSEYAGVRSRGRVPEYPRSLTRKLRMRLCVRMRLCAATAAAAIGSLHATGR
jgi:hypothetical protein